MQLSSYDHLTKDTVIFKEAKGSKVKDSNIKYKRIPIEIKYQNNKYMATLPSGKKVHFGSPKYPDYTIHKDKERRDKYLARATKIKNKQGELTYTNPESSNYWSVNLLWPKKN